MQTIPLYRYTRPDGGVTVSTVKPDGDYTKVEDTENVVETITEKKAKAYDILTGVSE